MKGLGHKGPIVHFRSFFWLCSDLPNFWPAPLNSFQKHYLAYLFTGLALVFEKKKIKRPQFSLEVLFGDLLLIEKEKKPFVSLNNDIMQ